MPFIEHIFVDKGGLVSVPGRGGGGNQSFSQVFTSTAGSVSPKEAHNVQGCF